MATTMYNDLVKKLRYCGNAVSCIHCPYWEGCAGSKERLIKAADVIEELQKITTHYEEESKGWWLAACDVKEERERLKEQIPKWIPVTERLPEKGIDVLVFAEGKIEGFFGDTVIAISKRYNFKMFTDSEGVEVWQSPWQYFLTDYEITHWMPLPEPPKDDEE